MRQRIEVTENNSGRLDAYLAQKMQEVTRSFIKTLITGGNVTVNGQAVKAGYSLKVGDVVEVELPEPRETEIVPQDIPIEIVYQDADVAVINKPQGMVTHPAAGNPDHTLVNAVMFHIRDLSGIGGELRPGIVHRLDKDTSGLILIAKNDKAHISLSEQLQNREIKKTYVALCHGNIKEDKGTIRTLIDRNPRDRKKMAVTHTGKEAVSHFEVLERFGQYTLVEFNIETGRTHQIRVHAKHMGHPVVGDPLYTRLKNQFAAKGQMLHAKSLLFTHPISGERIELEAPLPDYFAVVLERLRKNASL